MKYFLTLLILSISLIAVSQEEITKLTKPKITHTVGIQYNPYLNRDLFSADTRENIYAFRYGLEFNNFSLGLELFDHTYKQSASEGNTVHLGIYSRYTFLRSKSLNPFAEVSTYYSSSKTTILDENLIQEDNDEFTNTKMGYYIAPGFSIKLYKTKVSMDLMLKISTVELINGAHFIPSYKINYHF